MRAQLWQPRSASCVSILYIWCTPGAKTPISAPSRTKTPAVAGNGVPAHRTSAGRTQGTRASAPIQLASSKALVADRGRVIQPKSESCPMDGDMEKERPTPWHRTLHGPRTTADGIWPSPGMLPATPTSNKPTPVALSLHLDSACSHSRRRLTSVSQCVEGKWSVEF